MNQEKETAQTIQGRLEVLRKALVSEENSVEYYKTLLEKTPGDTEENIGMLRIYEDLRKEETKHVVTIQSLITHWEKQLKEHQAE